MRKSFSDLEYAAKKKLTSRDRFLAEIDKVTPWSQLHQLIEPFYPKVVGAGRPPVGLARMLRMYVAQQCFGLSDEGIEDAIYDSQAIRGFVGIGLNRESAPDATTLLKFRRLLEKNELTRKIFDTINGHLAAKGFVLLSGAKNRLTLHVAADHETPDESEQMEYNRVCPHKVRRISTRH
jgi:IS5 family transposase